MDAFTKTLWTMTNNIHWSVINNWQGVGEGGGSGWVGGRVGVDAARINNKSSDIDMFYQRTVNIFTVWQRLNLFTLRQLERANNIIRPGPHLSHTSAHEYTSRTF